MGEVVWKLIQIIGLIYCTAVGLMAVCMFLIIWIRLTDYAIHSDDYKE